jgi:tetratricopeptide (TPR) repeat protein
MKNKLKILRFLLVAVCLKFCLNGQDGLTTTALQSKGQLRVAEWIQENEKKLVLNQNKSQRLQKLLNIEKSIEEFFSNDAEALCETREWVGIKLFKEGFEQSAIPIIQKVIDANCSDVQKVNGLRLIADSITSQGKYPEKALSHYQKIVQLLEESKQEIPMKELFFSDALLKGANLYSQLSNFPMAISWRSKFISEIKNVPPELYSYDYALLENARDWSKLGDIKESNQAYLGLINRLINTNNCSKDNFSIVLESIDSVKESLDQATLSKLLAKIWNHPSVVDYNESFVVGQLLYQKKEFVSDGEYLSVLKEVMDRFDYKYLKNPEILKDDSIGRAVYLDAVLRYSEIRSNSNRVNDIGQLLDKVRTRIPGEIKLIKTLEDRFEYSKKYHAVSIGLDRNYVGFWFVVITVAVSSFLLFSFIWRRLI